MSVVIVGKTIEIVEYPFGKGPLTTTGVQYSTAVTSSGVTPKIVESVTIDEIGVTGGPGGRGTIIEVEFGITWGQKSSSTVKKPIGLISARDKDNATWVPLMTAQINATAGTTEEFWTFSGIFKPATTFTKVPFDVKVEVYSEHADENAIGRVKNSSYIRVIYKID